MNTIVRFMLALAMALVSNSAFAVATWEHFGADPAYQSREAAIADAPRVLRQARYPESVIALLTEAMKKPGTETHVTNGMKLDFMRSGKSALWRNVEVKFKKPPRETSMEYSAPAEEWAVDWNGDKWTVGIPKVCNNTYGKRPVAFAPSAAPTASASPQVFATNKCPDGRRLVANAWSIQALPDDLRKKARELIAEADGRDTLNATNQEAYKPSAVSRTLDGQLRNEVQTRADVDVDVRVQLRDPKTSTVIRDIGVLHLTKGTGSMPLSDDQRAMIVETIWPKNFQSPVISGDERRIWVFSYEWKTFCRLHVHGLVP